MKKIVQIAVIAMAVFACLTVAANAVEDNPTVKIGLYHGSDALFSANLQNFAGSGYQYGWYDKDRNFQSLGSTAETKISMSADSNIYVSGGTYYPNIPTYSYSTIGAWHIQLAEAYACFDQAQVAANCITGANAFPAWISGCYYVRVGSYPSREEATAAMIPLGITGGTAVGNSATGVTVTKSTTTTVLFEYDDGGRSNLAILPNLDASVTAVTWFKGYKYYGGFEYKRTSGGNITVINVLKMQDYIKGVIPYEMSSSWPLEALKAQAVCARTYASKASSRHIAYGFDFCNTTDCQVYRGTNAANSVTDQAVDETYGMYVLYQGARAETVYFSCDGGATEDVKNIWGTDYPYLKGVVDPYEPVERIPSYNWSVTYTKAELTALLKEQGYTTGNIVDVYLSELTEMGNALTVTFTDAQGKTYSYSRSRAKSIFSSSSMSKSLRSQRFTIAPADGNLSIHVNDSTHSLDSITGAYAINGSGAVSKITGGQATTYVLSSRGLSTFYTPGSSDSFVIRGTGWGHNVGMSQWGARGMADAGLGYDQIIQFYYTGVSIE